MEDLLFRYTWLLNTIYQANGITFDEINDKWMSRNYHNASLIPKKTFHTHKRKIEDLFDVNISCKKEGNGYYYYIDNPESLDSTTSKTLNTFYIKQLTKESVNLHDRILTEQVAENCSSLFEITDAMLENRIINIEYKSFWKDSPSDVEVEPYALKYFKQRWYLLGRNIQKKAFRIYALDRIIQCKRSTESFELPADFSADEYFEHNYGIIVNNNEYDIETFKIKAYGNQRNYLNSLPLHHTQEEIETNQEYAVFSYRLRPSYDFLQEILSHGVNLEVLKPQWFRERVKQSLEESLKNYR